MTSSGRSKLCLSDTVLLLGIPASLGCLVALLNWYLHKVNAPEAQATGIGTVVLLGMGISGVVYNRLRQWEQQTENAKNKVILAEDEAFFVKLALHMTALGDMGKRMTDNAILDLATPQQRMQAESLISKARSFEKSSAVRHRIVKHFESHEEQLKHLTVDACDSALSTLGKEQLEKMGFTSDKKSRSPFYEDIFLYLKVWLKNSIKYAQPLSANIIVRNIVDRQLYADAIEFVRDKRLKEISLPDEEAKKIIERYLSTLIQQLR